MKNLTYREAIIEAMDEEMARDPNVFIMGEDIGEYWEGPFNEYAGLWQKYGSERIRDTPISEEAFVGAAVGAAITGMRPIANVMFANFLTVPMDEIFNQMTKLRYMNGGKMKIPLTIISLSGGGIGAAAQHSICMEGLLNSIPGLKIVSPATPKDAKGLLKSAIRDDNPVIFFQNLTLTLSSKKGDVPEEEYLIPLGKADVKSVGEDITIIAVGNMVNTSLRAVQLLRDMGVSAELIDPRTVAPLDKTTILESVKKTGKVVITAEEPKTGGIAGEISAIIAEEAIEYLEGPVKRVCGLDTPIPFSPGLEKFWIPNEKDIVRAVKELIEG